MTSKTKQIIMAAIGAYLVYTGISLVKDTIVGEPKNQILFILVGVFFALFGLATIIWNIRTIVKETKAEIQGTIAGAEENEDGEVELGLIEDDALFEKVTDAFYELWGEEEEDEEE